MSNAGSLDHQKHCDSLGISAGRDDKSANDVERFVRTNYADVYRYLYHRMSSKQDAMDLTQETFLKYVEKVDAHELNTKGRAYLFTIARNVSNDFYRNRLPEHVVITRELEESLCADNESITDNFDEIISTLSADKQEILSLMYGQGFGVSEIAEIVDISRFAVRRKLKRALRELMDLDKESDHEREK